MQATETIEHKTPENFSSNNSRLFLRREMTFVPIPVNKDVNNYHFIRTKTMDFYSNSNKGNEVHLINQKKCDVANKSEKINLENQPDNESEIKNSKSVQLNRQKTCDIEKLTSKSFQLVRDKTKEFLKQNRNNFKFVRHKTSDCDVWEIKSIRPKDGSSSAYSKRGMTFGPLNTPVNLSRPSSWVETGFKKDKKIPILGPTRQQTEIYFKTKKTLQGLTLKSPSLDTDTAKPSQNGDSTEAKTDDSMVRNDVNTSSPKPKSSTTTVPMVANKIKQSEGSQDVRFFSEMVKPLQNRMQSSLREREKVITPSKHGYHPRSKSPTFKRLIQATEKLQVIADRESSASLTSKSESSSVAKQTSNDSKDTDGALKGSKNIEPQKKVDDWNSDYESEDSETSEIENEKESIVDLFKKKDLKPAGDAKVDFKVADTHAELHLFLPHINGNDHQNDRLGMESVNSQGELDISDRVFLPSIGRAKVSRSPDRADVSPARRFNRYNNGRKKKRKIIVARCPSAYDPEKRVHDHLNDVNTLISIENEKCNPNRDTICSFENCIYHAKLANANH